MKKALRENSELFTIEMGGGRGGLEIRINSSSFFSKNINRCQSELFISNLYEKRDKEITIISEVGHKKHLFS